MGINSIGPLELAIVLVIVLVIFGPKRLPGLGRQLGSGMREFKDSITGKSSEEDESDRDERPAIASATGPSGQPAVRSPADDPRPTDVSTPRP